MARYTYLPKVTPAPFEYVSTFRFTELPPEDTYPYTDPSVIVSCIDVEQQQKNHAFLCFILCVIFNNLSCSYTSISFFFLINLLSAFFVQCGISKTCPVFMVYTLISTVVDVLYVTECLNSTLYQL